MADDARFPAPEGWLEYADWRGDAGTVVGRLLVNPSVRNAALGNDRHVLVLLPPSLDRGAESARDRRWPVLYLHDGQNLFDARTGPDAEWQVDETIAELADEGIEAIVVGIPNGLAAQPHTHDARALEYTRYPHRERSGGGAPGYLDFLVDTVKPLVDAAFPTLPEREATGIAGSSLGGLISLDALIHRGETFGFAGVCSPALWFDDRRLVEQDLPRLRPPARIWVDVGGHEGNGDRPPDEAAWLDRRYVEDARDLVERLRSAGFRDGDDLRFVEEPDAIHHETAWARRTPEMLRFLLSPWRR